MVKRCYDPNRPKVPELVPLIRELYGTYNGGAGCCCHVMLDDGNYDCANFCLEYAQEQAAQEKGHDLCVRIAVMCTKMSPTQIASAVRKAHHAAT